jgi:geranylgeranyl reductase family protein
VVRGTVDVLIVGAGPAGAALALALARRGREVLVIERSRFPRDKPCGDCLNPGAVAELERLGIAARLRSSLAPQPLRGWYVEAADGRAFRATFGAFADGSRIEGWAVRRRDFDAELLSQAIGAGARVGFGLHVIDVLRERGRSVGVVYREGTSTAKIRARLVVGADGLRSVVQRRLGLRRRPPRLRKIALVGHLAGANGSGDIGELRVRGGRTCGYAPVPSGANITLVIPEVQAAAARGKSFLHEALSDFPEVRDRALAAGWENDLLVTGPFDCPVQRPWAPGALLVGDAAGYYDPFTGQGIHQALRSAAYAAVTIERILRTPSREISELRRYSARMWSELTPKRIVQRAIEAVIGHPERMSRVIRTLADGDGTAARRLLQVTGDVKHPLTLLAPATWLHLLASAGIGDR